VSFVCAFSLLNVWSLLVITVFFETTVNVLVVSLNIFIVWSFVWEVVRHSLFVFYFLLLESPIS
jgi:hypothetical protein